MKIVTLPVQFPYHLMRCQATYSWCFTFGTRERHGDWRERHRDWRLDTGANEYLTNIYVSIPYLSFEDSTSIVQTVLRYYYALSNKALTVELLNVR